MSRSPLFVQSLPRPCRALLRFAGLSAVLLCAVVCRPPAAPRTSAPPLEKEIQGGEVHTYPIELQTGQFLRVVADEKGIDLALRLFDSQGVLLTGADNARTRHTEVSEELAAMAETTGPHRLEVAALGQGSGWYLLRVEDPRAPTEEDEIRAEAVRALWDGATKVSAQDKIQPLERALALWRKLGDFERASEVLFGLGINRYGLKTYEAALMDFQQAAEYWAGQPGRRSRFFQAESLTWVGRCLWRAEHRREARAAHEQALAIARESAESSLEAQNLNLLGRLDVEEGELRKGMEWLLQALDMARKAGNRETEIGILNNLAIDYERLGEVQQALEYYHEALELAREITDREHEMIVCNNLGDTYRLLGNWETAFDYYRVAAEISGSTERKPPEILINLADAYRHRRQFAEARSLLDRALVLGRQSNDSHAQVFALGHLALLLLQLQQPAQAAEDAREAVGLGGPLQAQNFSHHVLGKALLELGDAASARAAFEKALALARRRGVAGLEAELQLVLARMDREGGDPTSALARVRSAIELIEERRGGVVDPELRISFLASKQDYYELQVDSLMALHAGQPSGGFVAEALRANEQARARGLLETLNEAGANVLQGVDPVLTEKERSARNEVNARDWYRRELLAKKNADPEKLAQAERKLAEALDRYRQVQVELRQNSPRYAALTQPQTLSLEEIQRQVIDGDALLLEYSLGAKRSFLWAVSSTSVTSFELPGREEIETAALRYYELLTVRNNRWPGESVPAWKKRIAEADAQAERAARQLARLILGPAGPLLGDRTLLIVADGALQYIPFAALPITATGAPLASRNVIVNLPSASVLAVLRRELRDRPRAGRTLAIFADPVFQEDDERLSHRLDTPAKTNSTEAAAARRGGMEENREKGIDLSNLRRLTFSQKEADAIAALVSPNQVFKAVGFAASRATVESSKLEDFQNVHFATHGVLESTYPEASGLVLSLYNERGEREDGVLRLNDVYNLRLGADLVVLSACRTALGKEVRGEGIIGLTRGFMYAGAARVLASLWSVEDRATAELMESFYRGMLREGLSPAAALRKAQLEMARKPNWKSPYFWAGFSLQGEWR